jgi:3-deoxy-D-manno-octulosonate 8-phosphate phosphatase (KDO 8-P phosphatase)
MVILPLDELRARARRVRLVLTDVDGTLTDAGVYYSERGEELKRFSLRDGMGVELLAKRGVATAFITRETSAIVAARAKKLRIEHCVMGAQDKLAALRDLEANTGIGRREMAYIGDDVNDVEVLRAVGEQGLAAAPNDAAQPAKDIAHKITNALGGHGAFRELADFVLSLRGE